MPEGTARSKYTGTENVSYRRSQIPVISCVRVISLIRRMVWNLEQHQCREKKNVGIPALKEKKET